MSRGRWISAGIGVALMALPIAALAQGQAAAAPAGGFDVDAATRAYLNLLQGPARAQSDAYFEGGYWLILWDALWAIGVYLLLLATGLSARLSAFCGAGDAPPLVAAGGLCGAVRAPSPRC